MRYRKYSILLLILIVLIACKEETLPVIENHGQVYADFELGVNFNDHMLAIISDDRDYILNLSEQNKLDIPDDLHLMMYTHQMDYLLPQIYYYIPMQHNFDTEEAWKNYFEAWETALTSGLIESIEPYVIGTDIEAYIVEELTDEAKREFYIASVVVLIKAKKLYLDEFEFYKEKIWPGRARLLYRKASYINEALKALNLKSKWEKLTQLSFKDPKLNISLTYYDNKALDSISIKDDKITIYYGQDLDLSDMVSEISFLYGRKHLMSYSDDLLDDIFETYEILKQDYSLYQILTELVDGTVIDYNNQIIDSTYTKGILPPNKFQVERARYNGLEYLQTHMEQHLFDLKYNTTYMIDGKLHYLGVVYNDMIIDDGVTIYHSPVRPLLIGNDSGLHIITHKDSMDSTPDVSPNGETIVFITPYFRKIYGDIHIYFIESGETLVISSGGQNPVKVAKWLDNNRILFVDDNPFDTEKTGGILKILDLKGNRIETLVSFKDSHIEVSNVFEDEGWYYTVITHDEMYENYTEEHIKLDIN